MNTLDEALGIAKEQSRADDGSKDAILTSFLEASKAKCEDGNITYRPYIVGAFYIFTTEYQNIMNDRYKRGLIKGDGAEWINPLEAVKEYILGLLRVQAAMDCGHENCIPDCWKADKIKDDILCGCRDECNAEQEKKHTFSAMIV
ncbi:MAG: hypothetical protein AAFV71_32440 [Cyanobacteria bacterium J06633_8]